MVPLLSLLIMKICRQLRAKFQGLRKRCLFLFLILFVTFILWLRWLCQSDSLIDGSYILDKESDLTEPFERGEVSRISTSSWDINGWVYYTNLAELKAVKPESVGLLNNMDFHGIWLPNSYNNRIQFRKSHLFYPPVPVGIGFRIHISGSAALEVRLYANSESNTIRLHPRYPNSTFTGFCNELVSNLPTDGNTAELIEIYGIVPMDSRSFLAIDKIVVTVGAGGAHRSLLYSLLSSDWCDAMRFLVDIS